MRQLAVLLFCLIYSVSGVAFSGDDPSTDKVGELCDSAEASFGNKDYKSAIRDFLEAVTYPEANKWRGDILYAVSAGFAMLGETDSAMAYLDRAVASGFSGYFRIRTDPNLELLRQSHAEELTLLVDRAKAVRSKEISRITPLSIAHYDNYDGPLEVSRYDWEDIDSPEMDTLRKEFQLQAVIGTEGTEFEKMKRLLNWVATRWRHDGSKMAPVRSALAILRDVEDGKRYCCANYADVLIDCMRALGYPIRFAGLRTEDAGYNMGGGHGCVEVWSNQYQKWILLDVQNNAWWEHNGFPLSAYECHKLYVNGLEDELQFVGQHEGKDYSETKYGWAEYFYFVISYWMGSSMHLVTDEVPPQLVYQKFFQETELTDQFDKVYPRLNQTCIALSHDPEGPFDSLTVRLDHTMPYFDHFLVRFDDAEWKESTDSILWVLNGGMNTVEAKAVSTVGTEGRPSRIELRYNPKKN